MRYAPKVLLPLLLVSLYFCLNSGLRASGSTTSGTLVQTLDGVWQCARDTDNRGLEGRWYDRAHFPSESSRSAQVPGSGTETWPITSWWADPPTNILWYVRSFSFPGTPQKGVRYYLRFGAIKRMSQVWLNGISLGTHEGAEDPIEYDVTPLLRTGSENALAVRLQMAMQGGIMQGVSLVAQPEVRILDVFARPDAANERLDLQITVENNRNEPATLALTSGVAEYRPVHAVGTQTTTAQVSPGQTSVKMSIPVKRPHRWDLDDPFLYVVKVASSLKGANSELASKDSYSFRVGFRDFRMANGYFQLNGRRIFLKSTHGNFCDPVSGQGTSRDMTYLGRDFPQLKKAGFNMMRFIMSAAMPEQLDEADEMGFLILSENETSWLVHDPAKFGITVNQIVRRDRNHPSLVLWGLLNETPDKPVYERARGWLPALRALDDTRPVILSSGRFERDFKTASISNTGSSDWDVYLGGEDPVNPKATGKLGETGAHFDGTGDDHVYPFYPLSWDFITAFLKLDQQNAHPVFLSECGIGSSYDPIDERRELERVHACATSPSWGWTGEGVRGITAAYRKYPLAGTYPSMEDIFIDSALEAARQRALIFSVVRSNPKINGYSLSSLEDFFGAGEGVLTNFREFKPGHLQAMQSGWAPLRWCLLLNPTHIYDDQPLHVVASLSNEDVLAPGNYPIQLNIVGSGGIVWSARQIAHITPNGPFASTFMDGDIQIPALKAGTYRLQASLSGAVQPAADTIAFTVTARASLPRLSGPVCVAGASAQVRAFLGNHGLSVRDYDPHAEIDREVLVVGPQFSGTASAWRELYGHAARGGHIVFISGRIFDAGPVHNKWLPLEEKGLQNGIGDCLYHKDVIGISGHPLLGGLPTKLMAPEYFGGLLADTHFFEKTTLPSDVAAVGIYSSLTDKYHFIDGLMLGTYPFYRGHFTLNAFNIVDSIGAPAADRLLLNMVRQAQADAAPRGATPTNYEADMNRFGFTDSVAMGKSR